MVELRQSSDVLQLGANRSPSAEATSLLSGEYLLSDLSFESIFGIFNVMYAGKVGRKGPLLYTQIRKQILAEKKTKPAASAERDLFVPSWKTPLLCRSTAIAGVADQRSEMKGEEGESEVQPLPPPAMPQLRPHRRRPLG
nr:hypothetical protein Iba_chr03cCG6880 [Ipomoea batatas]